MGHLSICLLGPLRVTIDEEPATGFESDKVRALLAYLAVEAGQPQRRETLAGLLWPDWPERSARTNLRRALANLRSAIGDNQATPAFLHISRQTIQFNAASDAWVDVTAFARLVEAAPRGEAGTKGPSQPTAERLEEAVALYRGRFLEGFSLADSPPIEDWILLNRERLHRQVTDALSRLAECHEQCGDYEGALLHAWRQVELDSWRERAHRQVMRLLALSGQRGAALAQYETCRRLLAEELGVEPAAETTRLYEQIRDGTLEGPPPVAASPLKQPSQPPAFLDEEEARREVEPPVFVAREGELARLGELLDLALEGRGRVAFVSGEAGSGKTALLEAFARQAQEAHPDLVVAGGNGVAYTGLGDPYHPFREVLTLLTGEVEPRWRAGAMTAEQARRLWDTLPLAAQALLADGEELVDTFVAGKPLVERARACAPSGAGWLAELEALVERKATTPSAVGPQQSALFAQLTRVLQSLARQAPLLLLLDDLQWADGGSISLLFHLGRQLAPSRILVVVAYRPEEVALGRGGERHPLEPVLNELRRELGKVTVDLGRAGGQEFVDALLDSEPNRLGTGFRETLYRQTRGHPLFTVELLRGMEERGDLVQDRWGRWVEGEALDWETLPARVEAVIAERIGRLPEELRETLVVACVEGEEFTAEVVARAGGVDDGQVVRRLSGVLDRKHRLVSTQGFLRADGQRLSRYRFRHILYQRYLYNSLDQVKRVHLHEAVGAALEEVYGSQTDEAAVELAYHFREAAITEKAIDYLRRAGERAARMSANEEAIAHFSQGLALLETLPETPERAQQELMLQVGLGVALQATRGYGDAEVGHACGRARELCAQVGETPQLFLVLWHLALFYGARGDLQMAHGLVQQLQGLAVRAGDAALAQCEVGWTQLLLGELTPARSCLEQGIALHDPERHRDLAFFYGFDPGVGGRILLSWALWLLGYPDQALEQSRKSVARGEEVTHLLCLAHALGFSGVLHRLRRDAESTQASSEACVRLSAEQGFVFFSSVGVFFRGWALAQQGRVEEGIAQMHQSIADLQAMGAGVGHPQRLTDLAWVYGRVGRAEEGLALVDEALEMTHRNEERWYEPETHRINGELLLLQGANEADAEACFQRAIKVAQRQSAKMWELRATVSLCRLWQRQGKRRKARRRLAQIYGWFSEGFDTPDLQEARALLEELGWGGPARRGEPQVAVSEPGSASVETIDVAGEPAWRRALSGLWIGKNLRWVWVGLASLVVAGTVISRFIGSRTTEPSVVKVWHHGVADQAVLLAQAEMFNNNHPNVQVDVGPWESTLFDLAGLEQPPCVIELWHPEFHHRAWSGLLIPLDEYVSDELRADLSTSAIAQGSYDGRLYGLGAGELPYGLIWGEADTLERAGVRIPVGVEDAWDKDEFVDALARLQALDEVETAIQFDLDMPWTYSQTFAPIMLSFGCELPGPYECRTFEGTLNGPEAVEALVFVKDLFDQGYAGMQASIDESDPWTEPVGLWWTNDRDLLKRRAYLGDKVAIIPPPKFGERAVTMWSALLWGIPAACPNPDAAWEFLEFLSSPEQVHRSADANLWMPARKSALAQSELYGEGGPLNLFTQLVDSGAVVSWPVTPVSEHTQPVLGTALRRIIVEGADVQTTLDRAVDEIDWHIEDNRCFQPP